MFQRFLKRTLNQFHIPCQCAVCDAWPASGLVCDDCVSKYAQPVARCATCALALSSVGVTRCGACLVNSPPLDSCLASVSYEFPWVDCVISYKFGNDPAWSNSLSMIMRSSSHIEAAIDKADVVLPIPLAEERLRERGFNQAHELCKRLASDKTYPDVLLRIKNTQVQSSLKRVERLKNVASAFAIDPLRLTDVKNKRVVVVDDVMTSGATLFAAAKVLRQAQAAHITAVVFARTEIL